MEITESELKQLIKEAAAEYIWGIRNPGRVANQYGLSTARLDRMVCEEVDRLLEVTTPGGVTTHQTNTSPAGLQTALAGTSADTELKNKKDKWTETIDEIVAFADKQLAAVPPAAVDPEFPKLIGFLIDDFNKLMEQILAATQQDYAAAEAQSGAG